MTIYEHILSTTYGAAGYDQSLPGNGVVETRALVKTAVGAWAAVVLNAAGELVSSREPLEQELAMVAPVVEPAPVVVEAAELRAQVAALTEANAAQAASTASLNAQLTAKMERLDRILAAFQA